MFEQLTPEEEDRRRIRRERNKLAAARCRKVKYAPPRLIRQFTVAVRLVVAATNVLISPVSLQRRLDHTNELIKQTEALEAEKMNLRNELEALQKRGKELKFIFDSHADLCKLKNATADTKLSAVGQHSQQSSKVIRSRPSSLPLASVVYNNANNQVNNVVTTTSESLVPIQTPSAGIFSLDGIMEGTGLTPTFATGLTPSGTGLTPLLTPQGFVSNPSCGGQQRNENIVSPDSGTAPKLVSL